MSPTLMESYEIFDYHVTILNWRWNEYKTLYLGGDTTSNLLEQAGGQFFDCVQFALGECMVHSISRLTDPPQSGSGRNRTLNLLATEVADELKPALEKQLKQVMTSAKPIRELRNKAFAHLDYDLTRSENSCRRPEVSHEKMQKAVDSINHLMNILNKFYFDTETMYNHVRSNPMQNANALLQVIKDGLFRGQQRREREEAGE